MFMHCVAILAQINENNPAKSRLNLRQSFAPVVRIGLFDFKRDPPLSMILEGSMALVCMIYDSVGAYA